MTKQKAEQIRDRWYALERWYFEVTGKSQASEGPQPDLFSNPSEWTKDENPSDEE